MYKLRFRLFQAVDDPLGCERFMEGHMRVLEIYGITKITSARTDWFYNPNVYVILAESTDFKVHGGIRIHIAKDNIPLPIEKAVGNYDGRIFDLIKGLSNKGTGELCGLWNSRDVAGMGVSNLLMRAGIAVSPQLNVNSLFALCAPVTVPMVSKVGFAVEESLGNKGTFYYPKDDLIATAGFIDNTSLLNYADSYDRECIFILRECPVQKRVEKGTKGPLEIEYFLKVTKTLSI